LKNIMDLSNKRILVTGANGQLGFSLVNVFKENKIEVLGTDRKVLDITNKNQCYKVIKEFNPDFIFHCAAYTSVDNAESDKLNCFETNVEGTRNLVQISKELAIVFVYFSTDYVFDGTKNKPYETTDLPNPINYYGLTKYIGEEIVKSVLLKYYIFRISWVFGLNGKNFVNTILRLSKNKPSLKVVNDQIGSPTFTTDVANFFINKINLDYGIHHLTNDGYISWFEFATEIVRISKSTCSITPISSSEYKSSAKRGLNSRLLKTSPLLLRDWKKALIDYINSNP